MAFDRNEVAIRFAIEAVVRNAWGFDSAVRRGFQLADELEAHIAKTAATPPAASEPKEPFSGRLYPRLYERVVVRELGSTDGILAHPKYLSCRKSGAVGVVTSSVPGHGGDAWFVKHEDGSVGVYMVNELAPAASPAPYVPKVGDVVVGLFGPDDGKLARVDSTDLLSWSLWCDGAWWSGYGFTVTKDARPATSSERAAAGLPVDESATKPVDREGLVAAMKKAARLWVESADKRSLAECHADAAIAFMAKGPAFDRADFNEAQEREAAKVAVSRDAGDDFTRGWIARARVAAKGGAS